MKEEVQTAIGVLQGLIRSKEEEIINLKRAVNEMCTNAVVEPLFSNIGSADSGGDISSIRPDQFYGQTIYAAARSYLEMRKAAGLGAASVNDIYAAIKKGGFKFEAKDDENAKNGLRVSLRKQSTIFHRLPAGDYGLLAWYPRARQPKDDENGSHPKTKAKRPNAKKKTSGNHPKEEEIPF